MRLAGYWTFGVLLAVSAQASAPLLDRIARADEIVVARAASGPKVTIGAELSLTVSRVLKGSLAGLTVAVSLPPGDRPSGTVAVEPVCGIFFLERRDGQLTVMRPAGPAVKVDGMYMPSEACSTPIVEEADVPLADRVVREVVRGVSAGPSDPRLVLRLFNDIGPTQSAAIADASMKMSGMSDTNLRLLGLAWRTGEGDATAIRELAKQIKRLDRNSPLNTMVNIAVAAYSNSDPDGVETLGTIAAEDPGGLLEQAASYALRSIHTREALVYAVRLLDSSNARVRENAVAAFSMFVLGVPLLNETNRQEALERALNPARRRKLDPDMESHVRFGSFSDAAAEAEAIQWWKNWYSLAAK